jgi:hypothetical protein
MVREVGRAAVLAVCVGAIALLGGCGSTPTGPRPSISPVTTLPVSTPAPQATPTPTPTPAPVLSPAAVPPRSGVSECSITLEVGMDGNASPVYCPDGGINVQAWTYFEKLKPQVMALSPDSTVQQVEAAMCADLSTSTVPIETSAGELAFVTTAGSSSASQTSRRPFPVSAQAVRTQPAGDRCTAPAGIDRPVRTRHTDGCARDRCHVDRRRCSHPGRPIRLLVRGADTR